MRITEAIKLNDFEGNFVESLQESNEKGINLNIKTDIFS